MSNLKSGGVAGRSDPLLFYYHDESPTRLSMTVTVYFGNEHSKTMYDHPVANDLTRHCYLCGHVTLDRIP